MSSYKDASPNSGAKKKGGMKNQDGREGPKSASKPSFADKKVDNMPNEGAPHLSGNGVIGKCI